ncbi:coiled coil domain-containing protein [Alkalimarinus coralli]|uniref:coiled coil domain-containing protein n=1 Tax=Alkalimarinus coralli TaxID=2935863 RepID=UPI00202B7CFA|nr:coiled coil domain-containing protein [Alkalimarinus coralli]
MNDKELYQQKMRAQLDEWKAELDKLKAKASGSSADTQLKINKHIRALESKIEEGKTKLSQLAEKSEDAWDSIKNGVESAWDTLKSSVKEASAKFKE